MTITLLEYPSSSQNQRVAGFEVYGDEQSRIYNTENIYSSVEIKNLINYAYRQIFNEQQFIKDNLQKELESQLVNSQITVRDFIRGLLLSDSFRRRNYEVNNNYRLVQMCIQRVLGREVYDEREKLAFSTVIATKGFVGFVDQLLNSDEYLDNFGENTVPYQRRRIIPQRGQGDLPFARMPRYSGEYLQKLEEIGYFQHTSFDTPYTVEDIPSFVRFAGKVIAFTGGGVLVSGLVAVALSAWGFISL